MQTWTNSMQRAQPFQQAVLDPRAEVELAMLAAALIAAVATGRFAEARVGTWCHA
jgi:hypothetical protein